MNVNKKDKTPDELKKHLRRFGLVMAAMFFLLAGVSLWKHDFVLSTFSMVVLPLSIAFFVSALIIPASLEKVEYYWLQFGEKISSFMTPVILTLSFFLLITPMGLLIRLFRKDLLQLKLNRSSDTYWSKVEKDGPASRPYAPY